MALRSRTASVPVSNCVVVVADDHRPRETVYLNVIGPLILSEDEHGLHARLIEEPRGHRYRVRHREAALCSHVEPPVTEGRNLKMERPHGKPSLSSVRPMLQNAFLA